MVGENSKCMVQSKTKCNSLILQGKFFCHVSPLAPNPTQNSHKNKQKNTTTKKHSAINVLRALLRLICDCLQLCTPSRTLRRFSYCSPPNSPYSLYRTFHCLVPAPFLSSAPRYGMTFPFLHDRTLSGLL